VPEIKIRKLTPEEVAETKWTRKSTHVFNEEQAEAKRTYARERQRRLYATDPEYATVTYDTDEDGSFVVAEVFTTARGTGYRGIFVDEDNVARPISQSITFYASPDAAIAAALVA